MPTFIARNTFDNRESVIPQKKVCVVRNGIVLHTFSAASVTALSIRLRDLDRVAVYTFELWMASQTAEVTSRVVALPPRSGV